MGDTLVLDRWKWLISPFPPSPASLIDVGCGNGWPVLNCGRLGYQTMGVGWDGPDLERARRRAAFFGSSSQFEVQDVRDLSVRYDLKEKFDIATCFETIEHIMDDEQMMRSLAEVLRPGGKLFVTSPNQNYIPMDDGDTGPFSEVEDGGHVRKGYTPERLGSLADKAGLTVTEIAYCSGWSSQKVTTALRAFGRQVGDGPAWALTFPLRMAPAVLDRPGRRYPAYSICMVATKR